MKSIPRIALSLCLASAPVVLAARAVAAPSAGAPAATAPRTTAAPAAEKGGPRAAELEYAARERAAGDLERFQGGHAVVVGASALTLILLILLIVVLV